MSAQCFVNDEYSGSQRQLLVSLLCDQAICSSHEEATGIIEDLFDEETASKSMFENSSQLSKSLQEYLGLPRAVAEEIAIRVVAAHAQEENSDDDDEASDTNEPLNEGEEEESAAEFIGEGECELCERYIKLTRHHLVPRSTWPRIEARLFRAAKTGDGAEAVVIAGEGLRHLIPANDRVGPLTPKKWIRLALQDTASICRHCHSTVHRQHDNMTLALEYNTIDKLLTDDKIRSFCKWANKQRAGKYSK